MLDKNQTYLLNLIIEKTSGGYSVLDKDELLLLYPKSYLLSEEELVESFTVLQNLGFIKIKYNDGYTFCVIATEKGKDYSEITLVNKVDECVNKKSADSVLFLGSFFGSILGGIISLLIAIVVLRGL